MTKIKKHRLVLKLRKQGKSYSQIKKETSISKSTLSRWLKKYPLSKERILELRGRSPVRIEKYRNTMIRKREYKLKMYYKEQKNKLLPLTKKELHMAGLFLYWGEGNKADRHVVSINNTDPEVLKFTLFWYVTILKIPKEKIKVYLHLYSDMDVNKEIDYWSENLNILKSNFDRPYIKKSKRSDVDQKGYGHGTCGLRVSNTIMKDKIIISLRVISDFYGRKVIRI